MNDNRENQPPERRTSRAVQEASQPEYSAQFIDTNVLVYAHDSSAWSEDLNHGQAYSGVIVKNPFADV